MNPQQGATPALLTPTMKASTPDEFIAGPLHSSLPKVIGEPAFEDLKIIWCLLNTNTMSVSSYEGCGLHGDLIIIITNYEYFTVATDVFPIPANPGATAIIVPGTTASQISETNRAHTEAMHVHRTYHNVDQAFKKMIIDAFEDPFLNALYDEVVFYVNCTSLQFISHL
jgi:hypothetical protein